MQCLVSVIDDQTGSATQTEEAAIGGHTVGFGQARARIHTTCAVVAAPTLDRAFAR